MKISSISKYNHRLSGRGFRVLSSSSGWRWCGGNKVLDLIIKYGKPMALAAAAAAEQTSSYKSIHPEAYIKIVKPAFKQFPPSPTHTPARGRKKKKCTPRILRLNVRAVLQTQKRRNRAPSFPFFFLFCVRKTESR